MSELYNGGFEVEWGEEQSHKVKVFPVGGEPYITEKGEFHTPPGWVSWYRHDPDNWDQPEVGDIWKKHVPYRVHSGEKAARLFTFYRKHDAGFYQVVEVGRDVKVSLTAYAHAWSNNPIEGHEDCTDEGECSAGVGFGGHYFEDAPPLNGDKWNDAKGNFAFQIGIDPTGGTNPFSENVVWGKKAYIYNEYHTVPSVETVSQANNITVFLRSKTQWKFKHNDAYWDSVALEVSGTPTPPSDCHCPREDYEKTVVLLPQYPDPENQDWRMGVAIAGSKPKWSLIQSADDAFIGPPVRTIYAVNPEKWPGDLSEFMETYYPGAKIVEVKAGTPLEMAVKLLPELKNDIALGQAWEQWKDDYFGEDLSQTIGRYGCLLTGLSIVLRKVYGRDVLPPVLDSLLVASRVAYAQGNLLMWEDAIGLFPAFTDAKKDNNKRTAQQLKSLLSDGYEVILREVDGSHFVYLERVEGEILHIIDAYDGKRKQGVANGYAGVRAARVEGYTPPPPPSGTKKTGLHLQHMEEGWEKLYDADCSFAKVFSAQDVLHIMRRNENANIVLRNYVPNQEPFYNTDDYLAAGVRWVDKIRGTLYEVCDQIAQEFPSKRKPYFALESVNEEYENVNYTKNQKAINIDIGVAKALDKTDLPVTAGVYCAAVGNLHESQFDTLVRLAKETNSLKYRPWWGYHNYFIWNGQYGGPAHLWPYLSGRWEEIDKVLVQAGYKVIWYGGESGCIRGFSSPPEPAAQIEKYESYSASEVEIIRFPLSPSAINAYQQTEGWVSFFPNDGWIHPGCYDGNWMPHQSHSLELQDRCMNTDAGRRGDWLGNVLFTSCPKYSGWKYFWVKKEQIASLAAA